MYLHKVYRLNQNRGIVLPQALSREYGIEYGDWVIVEAHKDGIIIKKVVRVGDEIRVAPLRHDKRTKA